MDHVVVGVLLGAHGVQGEMRLGLLTDVPERFFSMESLTLYTPSGEPVREISLASVRPVPGKAQMLLFSPEITTPEEAKSLRGLEVGISREERPSLEEGEFWVEDLVGLSVFDADTGVSYGELWQVLPLGVQDVYVLRTSEGEERMFPAVRSAVVEVNLAEKFMRVRPPEGLWS